MEESKLRLIYRIFRTGALFSIFLLFSKVFAIDEKVQDLYINSDNFIVDRNKKTGSFKGRVIICFDDMELFTSEAILLYKDENFENMDKIIIPKHLSASKLKEEVFVTADRGEYSFEEKKLTLNGNVKSMKKADVLKTESLVYYVTLKSIKGGKVE